VCQDVPVSAYEHPSFPASSSASGSPISAQEHDASSIESAVSRMASDCNVDFISLRARTSIALCNPSIDTGQNVDAIARAQAEVLRKGREVAERLFVSATEIDQLDLSKFELKTLQEEDGNLISSCVHYLGSPRAESTYYGLVDGTSSKLVAYVSMNDLDWELVLGGLKEIAPDRIDYLVLSRMYVAGAAPKNTISRMLSLVVRETALNRRAIIVTAVDPNLGFSGAAYEASGWRRLFSVAHLGYNYVYGQFYTRRELIRAFGTDDIDELRSLPYEGITVSGPMPFDTLIFATGTDKALRRKLATSPFRQLCRC
jgi:hypothetical protein